jgi:hypothetical protein
VWILVPGTADAYIHLAVDTGTQVTAIRWKIPRPRWYASDRGVPGVSASQFQAELQKAFATWEAVPTASIGFQFGGVTSATPFEDDGLSVFGFEDQPDMERVLGATTFLVDVLTGEIVESDVFFNTAFAWSVADAGEASRFDLRSVATHEIGHFIGLGHSAIGETELRADGGRRVLATGAVMFPIALGRGLVSDRTLQADDIAGVSDLYPDGDFSNTTGIITGRVRLGSSGVFGAHIVAFDPLRGTLIGGFALGQDGTFRIAGLAPGPHVIRVEPLDDGDIESFMSAVDVNVNFLVTFHPRLIVAPAGGASQSIDVTVQAK